MVELDQISQISDSVVSQTGNKISMTDGTECSFVGSSLRNCTMGRDGRARMERKRWEEMGLKRMQILAYQSVNTIFGFL